MSTEVVKLTPEVLSTLKGYQFVNGAVLVKSVEEKVTKTGKPYFIGVLCSKDVEFGFKVWDNSGAFNDMLSYDWSGTVAVVSGTVQDYQGTLQLILDSIFATDLYKPMEFYSTPYAVDSWWNNMLERLGNNLSEVPMGIFQKVMTPEVSARFKEEFAASSHHDNCLHGLLGHTNKCLVWAEVFKTWYPDIFVSENESGVLVRDNKKYELFILSVALHDIGKIMEMNMGNYTPESRVTHRILGLDFIVPIKQDIIDYFGKTAYLDLQSVIVQHHDEFDDKARTVLAQIVHYVDIMEAHCTDISQALKNPITYGGSPSVSLFGKRLTI